MKANQVFAAVSQELKHVDVSVDFIENALDGRSGSWCQFDEDENSRKPVTIPFFSFPETIHSRMTMTNEKTPETQMGLEPIKFLIFKSDHRDLRASRVLRPGF